MIDKGASNPQCGFGGKRYSSRLDTLTGLLCILHEFLALLVDLVKSAAKCLLQFAFLVHPAKTLDESVSCKGRLKRGNVLIRAPTRYFCIEQA